MKKLIALLSIILLLTATLTACSGGQNTASSVRIATIQGPTGIGMVHLMDQNDDKTTENTYEFQVHSTPDAVVPLLMNKSVDIAALPTNMAANYYNKTKSVELLAVNTLGVLYMLENGNTVNSMKDLKGKTIYSTGQGANPEYILNYILRGYGLNPETDVTIKFVAENTELASLMVSGEATIAMVPQPLVSSIMIQKSDVRIALSMNDEWEKVAGEENKLMMGCVIVRKEFLEKNPKLVKTFMKEYEASIKKTTEVDATAALCEEYGIIAKAAIAKKAIPFCEITYIDGKTMKKQIAKYYNVLFESKPQSIGSMLPDDDFYYGG